MSKLREMVRQVKPVQEIYCVDYVDRVQNFLSEAKETGAFSVWLNSEKDIDKWLKKFDT
ncbi:uncharacterized protein METZ01_LOCUS128217, partial [marine metagenome]